MRVLAWRPRLFTFQLAHQSRGRVARHLEHRLAHRGEPRPDEPRDFRIVEPGDREIAGHLEPETARRLDRGHRHVVILGEDRRRPRRACEQPARRRFAARKREVALLDRHLAQPDPGGRQRLAIAFEARLAGVVGRIAQDDSESPVAEREQMFRESARVFQKSDDLFALNSWIQVMMGQGITPQSYHPVADLMGRPELTNFLGDIQLKVARTVAALPSHQAYVEQLCAPYRQASTEQLAATPLKV